MKAAAGELRLIDWLLLVPCVRLSAEPHEIEASAEVIDEMPKPTVASRLSTANTTG